MQRRYFAQLRPIQAPSNVATGSSTRLGESSDNRCWLLPQTLIASVALCLYLNCVTSVSAQSFVANYDETHVPAYQLPELIDSATAEAADFETAWKHRRELLLQLFAQQMYGTAPSSDYSLSCEKLESGPSCDGAALRQQWRVTISTAHGALPIDLLVFTPAVSPAAVPTLLCLNFSGNHTVSNDPEIRVTQSWVRENEGAKTDGNRATAAGRGAVGPHWPIAEVIAAGMGVATAHYGDIDPDFDDGFENGVHALFPDHRPTAEHPERWGSIAAWAWGMSRLLDALETNIPEVDAQRVAALGHSRLGKTALWAGATDQRFAAVISNNSGCGGAALSRRAFGETVGRINTAFPHWFCGNFKQYNNNESALPIDQHQLLALAAPRLLYVASAAGDRWADPHGEFISLQTAAQVYEHLPSDQSAGGKARAEQRPLQRVGYHLRDGQHNLSAWDWEHYVRFLGQL